MTDPPELYLYTYQIPAGGRFGVRACVDGKNAPDRGFDLTGPIYKSVRGALVRAKKMIRLMPRVEWHPAMKPMLGEHTNEG